MNLEFKVTVATQNRMRAQSYGQCFRYREQCRGGGHRGVDVIVVPLVGVVVNSHNKVRDAFIASHNIISGGVTWLI